MAEGSLIDRLKAICGRRHVLTRPADTLRYRRGYRVGEGSCLAVVRPGSLVELWRVLKACVDGGSAIILQAANTGLTGGSTPEGEDYDRPVVLISVARLKGIHPIRGGHEVICLPGATLHELETVLAPLGREPHSLIGSSCIGASVVGGVCNNSGGALVRRGPAYTKMALYAQVDGDGRLRMTNALGADLGDDIEAMLTRVERGDFADADFLAQPGCDGAGAAYGRHVRDTRAATPARYNADPRLLCGAAGSAGKVAVFAVRLPSFPREEAHTFYLGTNDPQSLEQLRRDILERFPNLPISGEYIHREAFEIARIYGKDVFLAIRLLGTQRLHWLFAAKTWIDRVVARIRPGGCASDRVAQWLAGLSPEHLPRRLLEMHDRYEHHLILNVDSKSVDDTRNLLNTAKGSIAAIECNVDEAAAAFRHRFAVAGAAVRVRAIHRARISDIVAIDCALPRNMWDWFERLPETLERQIRHKLYYGHFFCHVMHQDYILHAGCDPHAFEAALHELLDARGAEYPAEHNVGHLYPAKPALRDFYRSIDPTNTFNPGIGKTSKARNWGAG